MNDIDKISRLIEAGGKEWQCGDLHRIYFNADIIMRAIGLEINRYYTGNISSVFLKGKPISNSEGRRILSGKCFFDVRKNTFAFEGYLVNYRDEIMNFIKTLADHCHIRENYEKNGPSEHDSGHPCDLCLQRCWR